MGQQRKWRSAAILAVSTLGLVGCGGSASGRQTRAVSDGQVDKAPAAKNGSPRPQKVRVTVDAKAEGFNATFFHYFPSRVTARPGDTIEFVGQFTGEPHTVITGSAIAPVFAVGDKYKDVKEPPPESEAEFEEAYKSMPKTFNEEASAVDGSDLFVQAGFEPCFYPDGGSPPVDEPCDAGHQVQPAAFTGTEAIYSSGFMADEGTFRVPLADDLKPGTYRFTCAVHGTEMIEEVTVVTGRRHVPTPAEVDAAGAAELDGFVKALSGPTSEVQNSTGPDAKTSPDTEDLDVPGFVSAFPKEISVKAGDTVTWHGIGFHSVTFNGTEDMRPAWGARNGKGLYTNPKSFLPLNSPAYPPPPAEPSGDSGDGASEDSAPPPPAPVLAGGSFDGAGIKHSGLGMGDVEYDYQVIFTKPGTYQYFCVVHPDMEGVVKVS